MIARTLARGAFALGVVAPARLARGAPAVRCAASSARSTVFAQQSLIEGLPVSFGDISEAWHRIRHVVKPTAIRHSSRESLARGCEIFFKDDFDMPTGSFKERGARNALLHLTAEQRASGVIAASAGNHAQALAYHANDLGIKCTVVMPRIAPLTKIQNCFDFGAEVILEGEHLGEARAHAEAMAEATGMRYVNGYDDPAIIAGAGTMGLEILEQVPDVEAIVIPVGGGGLIAGVSLAIKTLKPDCRVIGVEPRSVASLTAAMEADKPVLIAPDPTVADGLLVPMVGSNAFQIAKLCVDDVHTVSERWIALAMLRLLEHEKSVVEGGGATGYAGILANKIPGLEGKKVVVPLCGGNVDMAMLGRVIDRGLAADARLIQFTATVSDRPGGIANLTRILAEEGVSIRDIFHERAWVGSNTFQVRVKIVAETSGADHAGRMFERLKQSQNIALEVESSKWHFFRDVKDIARSAGGRSITESQRESLAEDYMGTGSHHESDDYSKASDDGNKEEGEEAGAEEDGQAESDAQEARSG